MPFINFAQPPYQEDFTEDDIRSMDVGRRQLRTEWPNTLYAPAKPGENWKIILPFANTYKNAFLTMCDGLNAYPYDASGGRLIIFLNGTEGDEEASPEAVKWVANVGDPVAIKDFLAISFALDYDRQVGDPKKPQTEIGAPRAQAKPYGGASATAKTEEAADALVEHCVDFLGTMTCYESADSIVAMPPSDPSKAFNLPRYLAKEIAKRWGREDLSARVTGNQRNPIKGISLDQKLDTLLGTITVEEAAFDGRKVLLLDDLYQSGVSMNYGSFLLREAGATKVFGLACRVRKLLKRWRETPELPVIEGSLMDGVLTPAQIAALPQSRDRVKRHWDDLLKRNVLAVSLIDPQYPAGLRNALGESAPVLLLCLGNLKLLNIKSVGFCGSREASQKGLATSRDSATLLANARVNIVSGFTAGVDMNAHRAALMVGGTTTVVLAEGILRFRVKKDIRDVWDDARTLVVSEFGPNLPWSVSHAMQRNKTICGLSKALVLVEAHRTGGSIEAGRECLRIGLPLFAAVYEGAPESATGNEELLNSGARRLMRSRSRDQPNVTPILEALARPEAERAVIQPQIF